MLELRTSAATDPTDYRVRKKRTNFVFYSIPDLPAAAPQLSLLSNVVSSLGFGLHVTME